MIDSITTTRKMTIKEITDKFGDYLTEEEIKKLKEMIKEEYKISIKENKHVFSTLTTRSQVLVFTEILRFSDNGIDYFSTEVNTATIRDRLDSLSKPLSRTRYLAIVKEIADRGVIEWIEKGHYRINQDYIERL
jgi:protein gp37